MLGNSANWWRKLSISHVCVWDMQMSLTRERQLFNKNTTHRKAERLSTVGDACSPPVRESPFQGEEALAKSGGNSDPLEVA